MCVYRLNHYTLSYSQVVHVSVARDCEDKFSNIGKKKKSFCNRLQQRSAVATKMAGSFNVVIFQIYSI